MAFGLLAYMGKSFVNQMKESMKAISESKFPRAESLCAGIKDFFVHI